MGLPPTQPSQFQVKVGLGSEIPFQVKVVVALFVEGLTHILLADTEKMLVGVGLTVTKTLAIGEVQVIFPGLTPGLTICKVIVLVPAVFQLKVWGPAVVGFPPLQPPQFQL
jgi:hypothetical protein